MYNIRDWDSDDVEGDLHDEENGCGALTGWDWSDENDDHWARVWFNLPFFMKEGCVERAIVSAGGPKISCEASGLAIKRRQEEEGVSNDTQLLDPTMQKEKVGPFSRDDPPPAESSKGTHAPNAAMLEKRAPTSQAASQPSLTATPTYTYSSSFTSHPPYIPQSWPSSNNTVVITISPADVTVFTSTIVPVANSTTSIDTCLTSLHGYSPPSIAPPSTTASAAYSPGSYGPRWTSDDNN